MIQVIDPRMTMIVYLSTVTWISTAASIWGAALWAAAASVTILMVARRYTTSAIPTSVIPGLAVMALITCVLYILFTPPRAEYSSFQIGPLALSYEGLIHGTTMALRLISLAVSTLLLLIIHKPIALAAGVTRVLLPLSHIGLSVTTVFYFTFFLMQMIPTLFNEVRDITLAQRSRCNTLSGSSFARLRMAAMRVTPVYAAGLRRGDNLAMALSARGFDTTRVPEAVLRLQFSTVDFLLLAATTFGWTVWLLS